MKSEIKNAVKHTPGPWTLEKREKGCKYWQIGNSVEVPIFSVLCERKEAIANAQLIAAAPELLEACKAALVQIKQDNQERGVDPGLTEIQVRNAIAKATGETL